MATTPFLKMHGLGNDFVVLDARTVALDLTPERRRVIADRRLGVGCDQLIVLEPPTEREAAEDRGRQQRPAGDFGRYGPGAPRLARHSRA